MYNQMIWKDRHVIKLMASLTERNGLESAVQKKMATRAEVWVNRPNRLEVMSTNMAAGRGGKRIALNENDIYGAKLIKEVDLLTKTEAIRWLKCRSCRNIRDLTLKVSFQVAS